MEDMFAWGVAAGVRDIADQNVDLAQDIIDSEHEKLRKARALIVRLQEALVLERSVGAGMAAQIIALKAEHPDSRLFRPVGGVLGDGRPRAEIHNIYEKAYEAKRVEMLAVNKGK